MNEIKFNTIEDLRRAVQDGIIDESLLSIEVDNDGVFFGYGEYDKDNWEYETEIIVSEAEGYRDVKTLYTLLFPTAKVSWV